MKIVLYKKPKGKNSKTRKSWRLSLPMIFSFLISIQLIALCGGYILGQKSTTESEAIASQANNKLECLQHIMKASRESQRAQARAIARQL